MVSRPPSAASVCRASPRKMATTAAGMRTRFSRPWPDGRSSTNLQAGGRTRASAILHGAWLLALVALAPWVLRYVAVSSLAAVLVYTGCKLVDRAALGELRRAGGSELTVYAVTLVAIVATDLLIGIIVGVIVDWEALRRARSSAERDAVTGSPAPTVR